MRLETRDGRAVVLRAATNADRDAVVALIFEVLAEYGLRGEVDGTDACVQNIEKCYLEPGGSFEVVIDEASGEIVGCYGLQPHGDGVCELRKMYMRKAFRGTGLGRRLMTRALDQARTLGFSVVELDTAAPLKEAITLYESVGFREFDKPGIPARCDRAMRLDL